METMETAITSQDLEKFKRDIQSMMDDLKGKIDDMVNYKDKYDNLKMSIDGKLLSQVEAARMCGTSSATINRARKARKIKAVLIGKTWKYTVPEVIKYKSKYY